MSRYSRNPVGAHYGLSEWLLQRLTACVMAIFTLAASGYLLYAKPASWAEWQALFDRGIVRVLTMLFIASLLYHAWVGMRDILMDYLHATGARLAAQAIVGFVLLSYLIGSASILWGR